MFIKDPESRITSPTDKRAKSGFSSYVVKVDPCGLKSQFYHIIPLPLPPSIPFNRQKNIYEIRVKLIHAQVFLNSIILDQNFSNFQTYTDDEQYEESL